GDAFPDLAVADSSSANVSVLLNTQDWRSFEISGFPSPTTAGEAHTLTVTALDTFGSVMTGYSGTVHFASSDAQAALPGDYTFTQYDYGTGYFYAYLQTAGPQSITATDTANPGATGSQTGIHVNPIASVTGPYAGLRNQTLTFTLGATSGLPASTVFTYTIDWNGDGVVDQTVTGPNGATVNHSHAASASYQIGVTATVHIGA